MHLLRLLPRPSSLNWIFPSAVLALAALAVVTPRVVQPTRPGDTITTPLENSLPANDMDFFIKNKPEVLRTEVRGGAARVERGPIGHILELPKGDVHAAIE